MSISRKHLEIYYNFESKQWEFKVLGKNGCFVNRTVYTPDNEPTALHSGSLLQFGGGNEGTSGATDHSQGLSLCFLLPRGEGGGRLQRTRTVASWGNGKPTHSRKTGGSHGRLGFRPQRFRKIRPKRGF